MLATTPALSAGFERVTVSDPDGQPLEAGIWYPSEAPTSSQPIGLYRQASPARGLMQRRGPFPPRGLAGPAETEAPVETAGFSAAT